MIISMIVKVKKRQYYKTLLLDSPTETLLRLHLPLNDKVWTGSHSQVPIKQPDHNPEASPDHSIGRCDGRCVQRAGT